MRGRPARRGVSGTRRRAPVRRGLFNRRPPGKTPPASRIVTLLVAMAIGFGAITVRLVLLQIKDASALQALARDQRVRNITAPAPRGTIFDRNGEELAMTLPAKTVFADPGLVRDAPSEAWVVSAYLGLDQPTVLQAMRRPGRFVYLARGVAPAVAKELQKQQLPGIGFLDESRRYYPAGPMAPQVLGVVGVDGTGLAGLELSYQRVLAGRPGREVMEEDPTGVLIPQGANSDQPPVPGGDLVLTLDREIQFRAQEALAAAVKSNRAKDGTVIVMDPRTGDILAMVSYPWFDPNHLTHISPEFVRNRSVTDVYEPGSVNKVITAAGALQDKVLTLRQKLTVPDHFQTADKVFHDAHPHPTERMRLADVIARSSNIGAIEIAHLLGAERLGSYLHQFGLGSATGVGFPGESPGVLPPPSRWGATDMGSFPIGQGIAETPLQLACVYATIANGGVWVQPRLVRSIVAPDGQVTASPPPRTRRVVSPATAAAVTQVLAYAVDAGTGTQAQIPEYWVAGKTGTARKVNSAGTGYSSRYVASFIGFVPAAKPALVVAAVLDEPATVYGGVAAAPLFRDVARFALARLRVPTEPRLPFPPHLLPGE